MLATVVIDPPSIAGAAALFTLLSARSIARAAAAGIAALRAEQRRHVAAGALLGAWFAACFGWHAFHYPAWMLCYLVDPARLPLAVWYPIFILVLMACGAGAALWTARLVAAGNRRGAWTVALGSFAVWLLLFGVTLHRYVHVGTYAEWLAGRAPALRDQPAVMAQFNTVGAITGAGVVAAVIYRIWVERRRALVLAHG